MYRKKKNTCSNLVPNLEERHHLEDLGIDGILKFIFERWMVQHELD
jgi:hypothetical protein